MSDNMTGSSGVLLEQLLIQELWRIRSNEQSEVLFELEGKTRAGLFAEMAMPIANDKDELWFGVMFRLNPTGPLMGNYRGSKAFLRRLELCRLSEQVVQLYARGR